MENKQVIEEKISKNFSKIFRSHLVEKSGVGTQKKSWLLFAKLLHFDHIFTVCIKKLLKTSGSQIWSHKK